MPPLKLRSEGGKKAKLGRCLYMVVAQVDSDFFEKMPTSSFCGLGF